MEGVLARIRLVRIPSTCISLRAHQQAPADKSFDVLFHKLNTEHVCGSLQALLAHFVARLARWVSGLLLVKHGTSPAHEKRQKKCFEADAQWMLLSQRDCAASAAESKQWCVDSSGAHHSNYASSQMPMIHCNLGLTRHM